MRYRYIAYNREHLQRGRLVADSPQEAAVSLERQGYRILELQSLPPPPSLEQLFPSLFQVKRGELIAFFRQLATLQECGVKLLPALELLEGQVKNRALRRVLGSLLKSLRKGEPLSTAMAHHPQVFHSMVLRVVEVSEHTGQLEAGLRQIAEALNREEQGKRRAMKALMYPALVLLLAGGMMVVLFTVALPPLLELFKNLGASLPLPTRIALAGASFLSAHMKQVLLGLVGFLLAGALASRSRRVRHLRDRLLLRLPLLGPIVLAGQLGRFSRSVSMLLRAGVSMPHIMRLAVEACGNLVLREELEEAEQGLLAGVGLSTSFRKSKVIPPFLTQVLAVGEEAGNLDTALANAADALEREVDDRMSSLLALLEPVATIGIALVILFIAYSVFVPIYQGMGAIK